MSNSTKKVLICEDEPGVRASIKLTLQDEHNIALADSGDACLNILKNDADNIGIVLLDIKMPLMNGLDVLSAIKKTYPWMPVIMITGYRMHDTAQEATIRGAVSYIVKPFETKEIQEKVRKFIRA